MPFLSIETIDAASDTRLALWRISEEPDEFFDSLSFSSLERKVFCTKYKSSSRQKEILAVRLLLNVFFGKNVVLSHNVDGRPALSNGYFVSISHTVGLASVIVSSKFQVSVDVERVSPRVLAVKDKFLRIDEHPSLLEDILLYWCTKEAVFKLYSDDHLWLTDIRITSVSKSDGLVFAENIKRKQTIKARYRRLEDYILVFSIN